MKLNMWPHDFYPTICVIHFLEKLDGLGQSLSIARIENKGALCFRFRCFYLLWRKNDIWMVLIDGTWSEAYPCFYSLGTTRFLQLIKLQILSLENHSGETRVFKKVIYIFWELLTYMNNNISWYIYICVYIYIYYNSFYFDMAIKFRF